MSEASGRSSANETPGADLPLDEGRRYWKAAIAHLAPEKREAAWDFYLDRLESSPAADTLGGVMLLLEAHLAFFDDLPARLVAATQQMEAAVTSAGGAATSPGVLPLSPPSGVKAAGTHGNSPIASKRKLPPWAVAMLSAALGAAVTGAGAFWYLRFREKSAARSPSKSQNVLLFRGHTISVERWDDAAGRRQRGCIVSFDRADRAEHTVAGGAKVYVLSPVEEVRQHLE